MHRTGYGRSDPDPNFSLRTWAQDYAELHDLLGLPPCPLVGWSGGGPYALACAVLVPALFTSIGLAASDVPPDQFPHAWSEADRSLSDLVHRDRATAIAVLAERFQWYSEDPGSVFRDGWEGPDEALLAQPNVRDAMIESEREGARQGSAGYVADVIALFEPWGFSLTDVTQEVAVWVGEADAPLTRTAAACLASTIARATLVTYPDTGHLLAIPHWTEMLAWLH